MGLLARAVKALEVVNLGTVAYTEALELQEQLHEQRARGEVADKLLLLEHPHVYTVGRRGSATDVLWDTTTLRQRGVEVVAADRGGQVTYHGPGQLVGYPIIDLGPAADLVGYVRKLEEVLIRSLGRFGLDASRDTGNTGVWVGGQSEGAPDGASRKIGAIGVRVTRGVTKHGFALNVSPDLSYFAGIVPCGILDKGVTSMAVELSVPPSVAAVSATVAEDFIEVFGYEGAS